MERYTTKYGENKSYSVGCSKCQKIFTVEEREKRHPERTVYFCSRFCANSHGPRTTEFKEKVKAKLTGQIKSERFEKICEWCGSKFLVTAYKQTKKCCSKSCSLKYRYKDLDKKSLQHYRKLCSFDFNLSDYPLEFDFLLIEKYGWYAAKNHGNNLGGVSRDHILSVKYGYQNNIDPKLVAHPANCKLLIHNQNVSKGEKCGMTLEQLQQKICDWNKKYSECRRFDSCRVHNNQTATFS